MADFYVDHGAYNAQGKLGLVAPTTWGVPQEGDGNGLSPSTTASLGAFKFNSVPTTGVISLCGATISTTGVIGAADANTAANTLATNINATTATVSSSAAVGTPQLRNLVYARGPSGGAAAGTCEVMMRIGSATLNTASNSSAAFTSTFDGSPTITAFTGGVSGCWGWLINDTAIGASSSIAALSYGVKVATPYVWSAIPTYADFILARTGAGQRITISSGSNITVSRSNLTWPLNLVFDTNTKWTTDSGTGVIEFYCTNTSGNNWTWNIDGRNAPVSIAAIAKGGVKFTHDASAFGSTFSINPSGPFRLVNADFSFPATNLTSNLFKLTPNQTTNFRVLGCRFTWLNTMSNLPYSSSNGWLFGWSNGFSGYLEVEDCDFSWKFNNALYDAAGVLQIGGGSSNPYVVRIARCRFNTNGSGPLKWATTPYAGMSNTGMAQYFLEDNTGMKLDSTLIGLQATGNNGRPPYINLMYHRAADNSRAMRTEILNGIAEWNPNSAPSYPYLNAKQIDGSSWAMRLTWYYNNVISFGAPYVAPRSTLLNRLATGVRTITQELFLDGSKGTYTSRQIAIAVHYTDTDGIIRREETAFKVDPQASTAVWTGASNYSAFVPKKLSLTTSYAVKQFTEVGVEVMLIGPPPGTSNVDVYIDPEFGIV